MRHTRFSFIAAALALTLLFASPSTAGEVAVSLRGSPNSMVRQNSVAKELGYEFVKTPEQLPVLVEEGDFVHLPGNEDYEVLPSVSYPYARPEVRMFVERLASQYRADTGEKLVVTSLTRPATNQPRNSHELSVHPAGIAIDFRISTRRASQQWLESVLLKLERQALLDVTRERYPPHYHVAIFPQAYRSHVESLIGADAVADAMNYEQPVLEAEDEIAGEQAETAGSEVMSASAVPAIEKDSIETRHAVALAIPLLAALFFGLGYWRGIARKPTKQPAASGPNETWAKFTVTSTR